MARDLFPDPYEGDPWTEEDIQICKELYAKAEEPIPDPADEDLTEEEELPGGAVGYTVQEQDCVQWKGEVLNFSDETYYFMLLDRIEEYNTKTAGASCNIEWDDASELFNHFLMGYFLTIMDLSLLGKSRVCKDGYKRFYTYWETNYCCRMIVDKISEYFHRREIRGGFRGDAEAFFQYKLMEHLEMLLASPRCKSNLNKVHSHFRRYLARHLLS